MGVLSFDKRTRRPRADGPAESAREPRLIEQEGSMIIWITDDARRIPVRSQIKSNIGKIEVKLQKVGTTASQK